MMLNEKTKKIIIVGCGGHSRVLIALLRVLEYEIVGLLGRESADITQDISGVKVVGLMEEINKFIDKGDSSFALAIGDNTERASLYDNLISKGAAVPALIHPLSKIEKTAKIENGAQICIGAIICSEAQIKQNTIINSGAIIDHECIIGEHSHIAPGAKIAGRVQVGEFSFVGVGASVKDKVRIGSNALIGAGSVVINDVEGFSTVAGVPAKLIKKDTK